MSEDSKRFAKITEASVDEQPESETPEPGTSDSGSPESGSRVRLLKVAVRLFAEKGLEGVTTRDLAREAGVNISLISYYFGGKEGLYRATFEEFVQRAQANIAPLVGALQSEDLTREKFLVLAKTLVEQIVRSKTEDPEMAELMMREELAGLPHSYEIYSKLYSNIAEKVIRLFELAKKNGLIRADIHCETLLHLLAHSSDRMLLAQKSQTPFTKKCFKFPEQTELFTEQLFKIFIEGVLT